MELLQKSKDGEFDIAESDLTVLKYLLQDKRLTNKTITDVMAAFLFAGVEQVNSLCVSLSHDIKIRHACEFLRAFHILFFFIIFRYKLFFRNIAMIVLHNMYNSNTLCASYHPLNSRQFNQKFSEILKYF